MPMPPEFFTAVKSTVDFIGSNIAQEVAEANADLLVHALTLDATTGVTETLKSEDPAIVWSIQSFLESPVDPLYRLIFLIGCKTTSDVSAELITEITGVIQSRLPNHSIIRIRNYSGETISEGPGETGTGHITSISVQESAFDNQSGMRMVAVSMAVCRDR